MKARWWLWIIIVMLFCNNIVGYSAPEGFRWQIKIVGPYILLCDYRTGKIHYPVRLDSGKFTTHHINGEDDPQTIIAFCY